MEIFDEEILNLWKLLNQNNVRYIVVGGFAVNLHSFSRYTGDLNLWIQDTAANRANLRNALRQAGMRDVKEMETAEFVPGWTSLNLPSGFELDLMTYLKSVGQKQFEELYQQSTLAEIHQVSVRFFPINQLIEEKKATGRAQDLIDASDLEKIKGKQP